MPRPKGPQNGTPDANVSPLDVMLETMRRCWKAGDAEGALRAAEKAAPYVHPRLSSAVVTHRDPLDSLSEDELRALVALGAAQAAEGEAAEGAAPPDVPPDEGTPPGSAVH